MSGTEAACPAMSALPAPPRLHTSSRSAQHGPRGRQAEGFPEYQTAGRPPRRKRFPDANERVLKSRDKNTQRQLLNIYKQVLPGRYPCAGL